MTWFGFAVQAALVTVAKAVLVFCVVMMVLIFATALCSKPLPQWPEWPDDE